MTKIYRGYASTTIPALVTVNGAELEHHVKHSPTGFSWGFSGSGPAELARCILSDYFGDVKEADPLYQNFKWDIIAGLTQNATWTLTDKDIEKWLIENG